MSFNPNLPAANSLISSAELRSQLNGLKALIDAGVLSGVVIDEVLTLPPGTPATASASMTGTVLHLSFSLPSGNDGPQGPPGNDGSPGEVTYATLNDAIAGTARNPIGLTTLDSPFADPEAESLRVAYNALLTLLLRLPT